MKQAAAVSGKFVVVLRALTVMILGLMALGAGVRTMNAGLSCPDWPLCFGKVIPDFHPGVYFEFIHRAYAGLVALVFFGCLIYLWRSKTIPSAAKKAAIIGLVALVAQIVMGGLTVLLLIKSVVVTSHLMLATIFFCAVLWMSFVAKPDVEAPRMVLPGFVKAMAWLLPIAVFAQVMIGGFVASTYAGSVCVDWPLCNGQWVPTWTGAIGIQIIHRFVAYALALVIPAFAFYLHAKRGQAWATRQLVRLGWINSLIVLVQVCVGVANLLMFIPPSITVLHQSVAILLLAVNLRILFVVREIAKQGAEAKAPAASAELPYAAGGVSG